MVSGLCLRYAIYQELSCKRHSTPDSKNLCKIPTGSPTTGPPNTGGVGSDSRFSTNISLYLRNGARLGHNYYGMLIGTRSIEWHYFQ